MIGGLSSIRQKILAGIIIYWFFSALLVIYITRSSDFSAFSSALALSALFVAGAVISVLMFRTVLRPIAQLGDILERFSKGNFDSCGVDLEDPEIRSLNESLRKTAVYLSHEHELWRKQLMHTEKLASLGTFLSGIAHELVNPLSNIFTSSQILMEEINEADKGYQKQLISQIEQESARARNIARSLLEFSRDSETRRELLSLRGLIEETIRFIGAEKPPKVDILLDIKDDISVFADKQKMQQAFLNLLKNAIEAIPHEGSVTVSAEEAREEGVATIRVHDTGSGIDEDIRPKVFDAFFTTKGMEKGSGLGLYITHEIIRENNGSIQVESSREKGTTFTIKLPAREA